MATIQNNSATIAKNTIILGIQMIIVLVVSLYTSRVVLQVLGVEDYGIYNVVCGFVAMFGFLNTSLTNAIQRFYNYELGKNGSDGFKAVYNAAFRIQLLLAITVVTVTELVGLWYIQSKMVLPIERLDAAKWVFHSSVISLLFLIIQVPYSAAIMAREKMGVFAGINVLDACLKLAIVLLLPILFGDKLVLYGVLYASISIVNFFLYFCYAKVHFAEIVIEKTPQRGLFKDMLGFTGWNLWGSFAGVMKEQGVNMVLNLYFGPVVNAARGLSYQINGALSGFVGTVPTSSRPQLTQSYAQGNISRAVSIMFSMTKFSYYILLILAIPVAFEIDYILKLWLNTEIPEYTGVFVIYVLATSLVGVVNCPMSFLVHATGKMKKYQLVSSIISLSIIPLSYFSLKIFPEPTVAFLITFIVTFIVQVASLLILHSLVAFSLMDYVKQVVVPIILVTVVSVIPPIIPRIVFQEGLMRLVVLVCVSVLFSFIACYSIGLNSDERRIMWNILPSKIQRVFRRVE